MSLAYGYDLKDDDKILEAPNKLSSILRPLVMPVRGALIDTLPFCAISKILTCMHVVSHVFSAVHSFMDPIPQLRTISQNR